MKWIQSQEAKKAAKTAEDKAWASVLAKFPNSDKSKFATQTDFADNHKATVEIYFKVGPGYFKSIFSSDSKYWPQSMKQALGMEPNSGFPFQLSAVPNRRLKKTIPAVNFSENIQSHIGKNWNKPQKIYITPTDFFTMQYRQIFKIQRLHSEHQKLPVNGLVAHTWVFGHNS